MRIRLVTTTVLAISCALLVAACGGDSKEDATSSTTPTGKATKPTGDGVVAKLDVRVDKVGGKAQDETAPLPSLMRCTRSIPATCSGTVECPRTEKSLQASGACDWLATDEARELLLEEPPKDQPCTMQYGGPEIATVTGTLGDEAVDATFSRQDGCAIARYSAAQALWVDAPPTDGPGETPPPDAGEPEVVDDPPSAFRD